MKVTITRNMVISKKLCGLEMAYRSLGINVIVGYHIMYFLDASGKVVATKKVNQEETEFLDIYLGMLPGGKNALIGREMELYIPKQLSKTLVVFLLMYHSCFPRAGYLMISVQRGKNTQLCLRK